MQKVGKFYKVSINQYIKDYKNVFNNEKEEVICSIYENIKLPSRATKGSAGYDFYAPFDITLKPNESIKIPTGIKVKIENGWFLGIFPRSSLGFKYRLQLDNTIGIIDSDYINSDNEGHIFIKMTNDGKENKTITIKALDGIAQGIFLPFGICEDDDVTSCRNGGFGSTDKH